MSYDVNFQKLAKPADIRRKLRPTFKQEFTDYLFYFFKVFIGVAIVYLLIRTVFFDPIIVSGLSMFPNYDDQNIVYVDQFSPRFSDYRRGEVVVLLSPPDVNGKRQLFIKRVIGLPGEQVVLDDGKVFIKNARYPDGVALVEDEYLDTEVKSYKNITSYKGRYEEIVLADDQYYLMGDNRTNSRDSRAFGPILKSDIIGREFYRFTPPEKAGFFKIPDYNIPNS